MNIRAITAPNPGPFTLDGTRTWLLGQSTVIDPGPMIESHIRAIVEAMPRLETILLTHRHADHAPAAMPLREATGAKIVAPVGVLDDSAVDRRIAGGELLDMEDTRLEVVATPGHTQEHVCFLTREGDLFSGDTVLGFGTTTIFPPDGSMRDYLNSLRLLRSRNPRRVYPGHGPTREGATMLLDETIEHRLERESQVMSAMEHGATSIPQMRERIYAGLDERLRDAAEIQIHAHLVKLCQEGRVKEKNGKYRVVGRRS